MQVTDATKSPDAGHFGWADREASAVAFGLGIHFESLGIDLSIRGLLIDTPPVHAHQPGKPTRVTYRVVPTDEEWRLGANAWRLSSAKAKLATHPSKPSPKPSEQATA